ncbi:MAG: VWA domain-containing protein [Armatimonadetes bacterium]|nr:VWA domain-containing protein [Armatimonadota bacterium]
MGFEFSDPGWLALLGLLVPVVWISARSRADLPRWRRLASTAVRCLILALLVLALAGLRKTVASDRVTTLFLVDRSLSAGSRAKTWSEELVGRAIEGMGPRDRMGVLTFASEAMLELTPSRPSRLAPFTTVVDPSGSDLAGAIRFSCASFPADSARRIVLISDGNQTTGDAVVEARLARALGVEIWTVPLPDEPGNEVLVESLEVPGRPAEDMPFDVRVQVLSREQARGTLLVTRNGQVVARQQVQLEPGRNVFLVPQRLASAAVFEYSATIEVDQDGSPVNNRATGVAVVRGRSRILYVHGREHPSGPIPALLRGSGLEVDVVSSAGLPSGLAGWQSYQALILDDVSAFHLSGRQMEWIAGLVREMGLGFAMIGGPDSYGVGGYYGSPIADILPVSLEIRKGRNAPVVALVLAIDKSGSMDAPDSSDSATTKLELAREAAIASASLLTPQDYLGVVGFDSAARWVVPFRNHQELKSVVAQIGTMRPGGGTDLFPALSQALAKIGTAGAPLSHVIVVTDGQVAPADFDRLCADARRQRITISTVAVGQDADLPFLAGLARNGKGRAYLASSAAMLPRIFTRDTVIASRAAFVEKPFHPLLVQSHSILRGVDTEGAPALKGCNLTTARPAPAQMLLSTPAGEPVLAAGRAGLGKTVAWTSDNGRRWATPWAQAAQFSSVLAQSVRWILPEAEDPGLRLALESAGENRVRVVGEARAPDGTFRDALELQARVIGPGGGSHQLPLLQTGPGRYEAEWALSEPGSWLIHVADPVTGRGSTRVWTMPYSPEYARIGTDRTLLSEIARVGGGRYDPNITEVFEDPRTPLRMSNPIWETLVLAALLLLPLDVAIRRVFLPDSWFRRKIRERVAAPTAAEGTLSRLAGVKKSVREEPPSPSRPMPTRPPHPEPERPAPPEETEPAATVPAPPAEQELSPLERLKEAKKRARS